MKRRTDVKDTRIKKERRGNNHQQTSQSEWIGKTNIMLMLKIKLLKVVSLKKVHGNGSSLGMAPIFTRDLILAANFYSDMSQRILFLIRAVI